LAILQHTTPRNLDWKDDIMNHPHSLEGRIAIVTGAARGIGLAIANDFIKAGAKHVICADILKEELASISEPGLSTVELNVCEEKAWQVLMEKALSEHGGIDILVNNAGILSFGLIEDIKPNDFRRLMDVNVTGTFLGMQAVIPHMKAAGKGVIINTSSASGMMPSNFVSAYAASKFAVRGLSRAAALELGPHGVRVNTVHPGGVNTPMTNPDKAPQKDVDKGFGFVPMQRGCQPEEIARGVTYLASDAASYCNGTELVIDGGMTSGVYFPGLPGSPM
jgi:3alpha(or 20beta)-hydroxysteroid dehydrogenase